MSTHRHQQKTSRAPKNAAGPGSSSQNPLCLDGPGTGPGEPICITSSPLETSPAPSVLSEIPDDTIAQIDAELLLCEGKTGALWFEVAEGALTEPNSSSSFCEVCLKGTPPLESKAPHVLVCTRCDLYRLMCLSHVQEHFATERRHRGADFKPTGNTSLSLKKLKEYQNQCRKSPENQSWNPDGACIGTIGKATKPEKDSLTFDGFNEKEKRWCSRCYCNPQKRQQSDLPDFTAEFSVFAEPQPTLRCYYCEYNSVGTIQSLTKRT